MTPEQIEELFISAAETERRLPSMGERPAKLKAQAIPYFHSQIDVNGWGSERYQEERQDFLSHKTTRLRKVDISNWELCNELVTFIPRERDRRCLWAWAMCEAGTLRAPKSIDGEKIMARSTFSRWCRDVEHIHRNTGTQRKNVAVSCIEAIFLRNTLADIRKLQICTLQEGMKISDNGSKLDEQPTSVWRSEDAFSLKEVPDAQDFSWAEKRNQMRRDRERKRQAA